MATYTELFDLAGNNTLLDKVATAITIAAEIVVNEANSLKITSASAANPTVITIPDHGLLDGAKVVIAGDTTATPTINGTHVATVLTANTISIPVNVTIAGSDGTVTRENHANRALWAKTAFTDPKGQSQAFWYAMLAANKGASVATITAATDSSIQNNVDAVVDIFAGV